MSSILARLCLALFACSAAVACEDEGPDTTGMTETGEASEGTTDDTTGKTSAGVTMGTIAMPPNDSDGDETGTGEDTGDDGDTGKGPSTTLAPPKLDTP